MLSEYTDAKGETRPMYNLTRDGFSLLVMGFTGERAYRWKVEFLKAFNHLLDENRRLKFTLYTDKIANLEAINLSKAKHHQNVINGYKSQISQKNKKLRKRGEFHLLSFKRLNVLYKNALADQERIKSYAAGRDKKINELATKIVLFEDDKSLKELESLKDEMLKLLLKLNLAIAGVKGYFKMS